MILVGTTTFRRHDPCLQNQKDAFDHHGGGDRWVVAADGYAAHAFAQRNFEDLGFVNIGSGKRLGVAGNKNRIIAYFLEHPEYDHLFLFEDDTFPLRQGWARHYIEAHEASGSECLLFLPPGMYGKVVWRHPCGTVHGLERDGGMLLSLTRRAVEKCGGLHPAFKIYGGEHSEYCRRLVRNGVMVYTRASPVHADHFIDGWDYANYQGRLHDIRMQPFTTDVHAIRAVSLREHAKEGLEIYERVKDTGGCFQHPGDWRR